MPDMSEHIKGDPFVWVAVMDPGPTEQYVGLHDEAADIDFIPIFLEKEEALKCYHLMARDKGHKYEIQAVPYSELCRSAVDGGFILFLLDGDGRIRERLTPAAD